MDFNRRFGDACIINYVNETVILCILDEHVNEGIKEIVELVCKLKSTLPTLYKAQSAAC